MTKQIGPDRIACVIAEPVLPIAYVAELELASDFAKASKSKATLAAYGSDFRIFEHGAAGAD